VEKIAPAAVGVVVSRVRVFAGGGYLHDLMIEHFTARKADDYFSQPGWLTLLRIRLAEWSLRTPLSGKERD